MSLLVRTCPILSLNDLAGRYKVRVVSIDSPDIQTPWQDIIVGKVMKIISSLIILLSLVRFSFIKSYASFFL